MKKRILLPILFWIALTTTFVILSASVALTASGYQFDWDNKTLTRTGLLYLAGNPKSVTVEVNRKIVSDRLPLRLPTVLPGEYRINISKPGYVTWSKTFSIEPGEARAETEITLFLEEPEISTVTDPEMIEKVKIPHAISSLINEREIIYRDNIVTRVSTTIQDAALGSDRAHIFFQNDRVIKVIEIDGSNETSLYEMQNDNISNLLIANGGKEILLLDGVEVRRSRVR